RMYLGSLLDSHFLPDKLPFVHVIDEYRLSPRRILSGRLQSPFLALIALPRLIQKHLPLLSHGLTHQVEREYHFAPDLECASPLHAPSPFPSDSLKLQVTLANSFQIQLQPVLTSLQTKYSLD